MALMLVLFGACNGCRPQLPGPVDDKPDKGDTGPDVEDTSADDTAPVIDTGPPPLCDSVEVEPNNSFDEAQELPMEVWACGGFGSYLDLDFFDVTPRQAGWIGIRVEAAARSSSANPQMQVDAGGDSALLLDGYLTTDPLLVFPANQVEPFRISLAETNLLYGDDYTWYMLVTLSKAPVEWDFDEVEPNDSFDEAQDFALDQTVFATLDTASDFDWYRITTPYEGEQTVTVNITAFKQGSAANTMVVLYDSDGTTALRTKYSGEIEYDRDPYLEKKVTGAKDLYLLVRTEDGRGSRFHWYTLNISVTEG